MLSRRALLRTTAASATAVTATSATTGALGTHHLDEGALASVASAEVVHTFVSMPDFFNGDVGDLRVLPTWDGGANSVNASWEAAIARCLDAVAAHRPDSVFVAGDMVEGRWNIDSDRRELFGPVRQGIDAESLRMCRTAITRAGNTYYDYYRSLFDSRGLTVYPAVGDHEILDDRPGPLNNRWSPSGRYVAGQYEGQPDNRYYLVDHAKDVWARHWTTAPDGSPRFANRPERSHAARTAYAANLGPGLTLVTVDPFTKTGHGVRLGVFGHQLDWLRHTITRAKAAGRVVIVQGHIPVMQPYRSWVSGDLRVPEGRASEFYRVLENAGADFLFTGEVHDTTVIQRGRRAPIQISHGCIFRYGFNYLVGRVLADGTTHLEYYEVPLVNASHARGLWSSDATKRQRTHIEYGDPVHRGTLRVRNRAILTRTKKLGVYHPTTDTWGYAVSNRTAVN